MSLLTRHRQCGMTMFELMVSLGIVGITTIFVADLLQQQTKNAAHARIMNEINTDHNLIQQSLRRKETCQEMLFHAESKGGSFAQGIPITGIGKIVGEKIIGGTSSQKVDSYQIGSIIVKDSPVSPIVKSFEITYTLPKYGLLSIPKTIVKKIDVVAEKSLTPAPGNKWKCGNTVESTKRESLKRMCDNLGDLALWDEATGDCRMKEIKCPNADEVPFQLSNLGEFRCVKAKDLVDLKNLINENPVNCFNTTTFSLVRTAGRLSIECCAGGTCNVPEPPACTPDGSACPSADCSNCCNKTLYAQEVPESPFCGCKEWMSPKLPEHCCGKILYHDQAPGDPVAVASCPGGQSCYCL